jgi:F0F1-type ATP synthase assembly protein I
MIKLPWNNVASTTRETIMARKLIWGILGGVILGAAFGYAGGNTPIGIAVCIAAGAIASGLWHYIETRRT